MRTYSSTEWNTLPNVILTSYTDWYPSDTDYTKTKDDAYFGTVFIHQNSNLMDLLICMGTMLIKLLPKIVIAAYLMLIHMMNTMTSLFTFMLAMKLPFKIIRTIFSHLNLLKHQNVMFNLMNMTKIYSVLYFFGYLMALLNRHF